MEGKTTREMLGDSRPYDFFTTVPEQKARSGWRCYFKMHQLLQCNKALRTDLYFRSRATDNNHLMDPVSDGNSVRFDDPMIPGSMQCPDNLAVFSSV